MTALHHPHPPTLPEPPTAAREDMLLLVDFKWMMSGLGWWVDLGRWRSDPVYASECIARGCGSSNPPLQRCAQLLQARLTAAS